MKNPLAKLRFSSFYSPRGAFSRRVWAGRKAWGWASLFPEEGLRWVGSFPLRDLFKIPVPLLSRRRSRSLMGSLNSRVNNWNLTSASRKRISRPQKCYTSFAICIWTRNGPFHGNNATGRVGRYVHFFIPRWLSVLSPRLFVFPDFSLSVRLEARGSLMRRQMTKVFKWPGWLYQRFSLTKRML